MLELEFSPEVDVQVTKDATGRTKLVLTPKFYSRRGQVALCYISTLFKSTQKPDDKYMLRISGATGKVQLRSADEAVEPAFLAPETPADKKAAT